MKYFTRMAFQMPLFGSIAMLLSFGSLVAQPQYSYNPGGSYGTNTIPFNVAPTASNRRQVLYTPADFPNAQPGLITKVYVMASTAVSPVLQNVEIKMGTTSLSALASGPWVTANMTTVFATATFSTTSLVGNWIEFTLQTPFAYDNISNFIIDFTQGGNTAGFSILTNNSGVGTRSKIGNVNASSSTGVAQLPIFGFNVLPTGPCTSPPLVGTTLANQSQVCLINSVNLSLSSFSTGVGQHFQWQYSLDSTLWVNMPNDTLDVATTSVASTRWFRCKLTCGTGISYSTPKKVSVVGTPLVAGTYTINGNLVTGGTNFNNFTDFAQRVNCGGVAGPITVNVINKGTPYNEQVAINAIYGSSAINEITINGNGQTLTFGGSVAQYAVLLFNGAQHVKVKRLNIVGLGASNCFGIQLIGDARYLEFDSCVVKIDSMATSSATAAFVASGSLTSASVAGVSARDIVVKNSVFKGGYYGFAFLGPTVAPFSGNNVFEKNVIRDFHVFGFYMANLDNSLIKGNDVNRAFRSGTLTNFYGMYCSGNMTGVQILGNKIHNPADANPASVISVYPFYFTNAVATNSSPMLVANNAIYELNGAGLNYGVYISSGNFINFLHNTINLTNGTAVSTTGVQRLFYSSASSGTFQIRNNIFQLAHVGAGTKHLIYLASSAATYSVNHNQYYLNAASGLNYIGYYGAVNASTFSAWQAINNGAFDADGVYGDAVFHTDNISPQSWAGNNEGANLLNLVPTDIFGVTRTATPDIGAVEYVPLPCLQPTILASSAGINSISMSWANVAGADSIWVEYGPSGFLQGTGTIVNLTGNSHMFGGLASQTCYTFFFKSWCGGALGNVQATITKCTQCAAKAVPFAENFDGITASNVSTIPGMPPCWSPFISPTHTGSVYTYTSSTPNSPLNHVRFFNGNTLNDTLAIISPAVQGLTTGNKLVKFWAKSGTSIYNQRVIIGTVASPDMMHTLDILDTVIATQSYAQYTVYLDTASGYNGVHPYVVFMQGSFSTGQNLFLDDISFDFIPQCSPPTAISAANITTTSAQITWVTISGTAFKVEYGLAGFVQGTGQSTFVNPATAPLTLTGLTPNTFYDVYVADKCDTTVWAGPITFKTTCFAALSGVYTVGGTAGANNFATLDSAITTLTGCGITGPVTFNLQGGTFLITPKTIGIIPGASATNTITFNGGGPLADTISFGNNNAGFALNGTTYLSFQNLTVLGSNANRLFWLYNNAHHVNWNNCHLVAKSFASSNTTCVVGASSSNIGLSNPGNNANDITITNCKLKGGYYGVTVYGPSTNAYSAAFTISNNIFEGQYAYGIRMYYVSNILAVGNHISNFASTTGYGYYGVYNSALMLRRNTIFAPTQGIYVNVLNTNLPPVFNSEISNNFSFGDVNGMYATNYTNVNVWHNTFVGNATGYYSTSAGTDVDIRNNIFVGNSAHAFYNAVIPASGFVLNYNLYHSGSSSLLAFNGSSFSSLTAWKTAQPAHNANSLQGNPGFVSATDFHILGSMPNDVGFNGLSLLDIDGDSRPASGSTTVDIGADEYTPLQYDVAVQSIIEPLNQACGDSATVVKVVFKNQGLLPITNVSATINVTGATTASINATYTSTLPFLGVDTLTVSAFNSAAGGSYALHTTLTLTGDQNAANNTLAKTVILREALPRVPVAAQDTVCAGSFDTLYYPANAAGMNLQWLTTTGDTLGITNALVVGPLGANDTTFVLRALTSQATVGPADNSFGLSANNTAMNQFMQFTVNTATTLFSVDVFAASAGLVDVVIQDDVTLALLFTHTVAVPAGGKQTLYLNQPLVPGSYRIGGTTVNNAGGLQSNSTGAQYPYLSTDGSVTITGNTFNPGHYYYFYNWQLNMGGCPRPDGEVTIYNRGAITAAFTANLSAPTPTGLDVNFNASASANATNYSWNFGDGNNGSGAIVTHTYQQNGTYTVTLIVTGSCGSDTVTSQVIIAGIGINQNVLEQSLNVYPNPTSGYFTIDFNFDGAIDVELRVIDPLGKTIFVKTLINAAGTYRENVDLNNHPAGVYLLQLQTDEGMASRKLIINK